MIPQTTDGTPDLDRLSAQYNLTADAAEIDAIIQTKEQQLTELTESNNLIQETLRTIMEKKHVLASIHNPVLLGLPDGEEPDATVAVENSPQVANQVNGWNWRLMLPFNML